MVVTAHSRRDGHSQFVLPLDPAEFNVPEADDKLHNPDPSRDRRSDKGGSVLTSRGFMNLGCILVLVAGMVALLYGFALISMRPHWY